MQDLSMSRLLKRRLRKDWALLVSVVLGIFATATLVAIAPIYLKSLDRLAFNRALNDSSKQFITFTIFSSHTPVSFSSLENGDVALINAINNNLTDNYVGHTKYVRTSASLVGFPSRPLPQPNEVGATLAQGYLQSLSKLKENSAFVEGRMANSTVTKSPVGPVLEGVIGRPTADWFDFKVGDWLTIAPSLGATTRVSVNIVGIIDRNDPTSPYWGQVGIVFEPEPMGETPETGVRIVPDEPPVAIFVTERGLIEAIGSSYQSPLVKPIWFVNIDSQGIQEWSISELSGRIESFEQELESTIPGADVLTGNLKGLIDNVRQKSFFSTLPLLFLLSIMVGTVLFYLAMSVSYLVQQRQGDLAMLRTRGAQTIQILRTYGVECIVVSVLTTSLAPFLAMGLVAFAGKLPAFSKSTGDNLLQVELTPAPFLGALSACVLCIILIIVPVLLRARIGILTHRTASSRPPTISFFHRHYVDFGLVLIGGLVYWELYSRGQIASGGLFEDVKINEIFLVSPVLFLTVVALAFVRFFPMVIRYLSGESDDIVRLIVGLTIPSLLISLVIEAVRDGSTITLIAPSTLTIGIGALYIFTYRYKNPVFQFLGIVGQSATIVGFLIITRLESNALPFALILGLITIVPAQIGYLVFKSIAREAPIWLSVALWHMSRNPLQYTLIVVLLLLSAGLSTLASTVGATLEQSQRERILHEVASDVRVSGLPGFLPGGIDNLKQRYLDIPGVTLASLAFRTVGSAGPVNMDVLALEPTNFQHMSWYRKDFSIHPLNKLTLDLQTQVMGKGIPIPDTATRIGLWAKPKDSYSHMWMWMVLVDSSGKSKILTLGEIGSTEWHDLGTDIPSDLKAPLFLASIQIFEPGGGENIGLSAGAFSATPGSVAMDNIYVLTGAESKRQILEDFERDGGWTPLPTSAVPTDRLNISSDEPFMGNRSGIFYFGKSRNMSVRGIYVNSYTGSVPIIASDSFLNDTGFRVGDLFIGQIKGRLVPLLIRNKAEYFPTIKSEGSGFIVTNLDRLTKYLNLLTYPSTVKANEIFVSASPGYEKMVAEAINRATGPYADVKDRASLLDSLQLDPLRTISWKAMVPVALGTFVLTVSLGFITYLLSFAIRYSHELAFLRSLGISRLQMLGLISFEHISLLILGLGLGTLTGLHMSKLMVSSVAVTEEGQAIVPPILFITDWGLISMLYGGVAVIITITLFILNRNVLASGLQAKSRND